MSQPISTRLIRRQSTGIKTNANRPTPAAKKSRQRTRAIRNGFDHLYWVICLVLAISNTQVKFSMWMNFPCDSDFGTWIPISAAGFRFRQGKSASGFAFAGANAQSTALLAAAQPQDQPQGPKAINQQQTGVSHI